MDNIIFEDPSKLQKASKRNLVGSLTQPLPHRDELPSATGVEETRELFCSPADFATRAGGIDPMLQAADNSTAVEVRAGLPMTSILPGDMQRQEAQHKAGMDPNGFTEMTDGSWKLSSLCRDFVLDPSTIQNSIGDHDSLFSTPEPDPEINLEVRDSLPCVPAQEIAIGHDEHEEGDRAQRRLTTLSTDPREVSTSPQLASHSTSPLLDSMISRSLSAQQVGLPDIEPGTGFPGQQQSSPTPPPDQGEETWAARSNIVREQSEYDSRVILRGNSTGPSQWERPSAKESRACEARQTRAINALSRTTFALEDDNEQQLASQPRQDAPQRMMAEPKASARVSRKPLTKSLRPEVIIPRRHYLALSKQKSPLNGDRPAELGSHATSRKSSANQSHTLWEVASSAGHKRQHFDDGDLLSLGSHHRRIKHSFDLVTGADVLSQLEKADVVAHSSKETRDESDWEQQVSVAPVSVQSLDDVDDNLTDSDRTRRGSAGKIAEHDLETQRCSLKANTVGNDTTTSCDIPTSSMRMKVQQVMPADAAFVTIFVDDPVELRTLLESPADWARSCGLSSTYTTMTNVTVSPTQRQAWLVTATLSWIDGFVHRGRGCRTRSKRSCSTNGDTGSAYRSSDDEKEPRGMKRGHWTRKEDDNLRDWKRKGRPWSWILDQFPERTEAAVKSRWFVVLAPRATSADTRT
ncbi:hypothetical protein H2200_007527 [Cladophialophora chaetospira]|uniref:Myb-like domain-containing protein n=1 Tax=Cladophialophora chaetospira TaxID=386627 RepID=A0AA38X853_9EURO|nr:hypothetical protein H2200_007527 [Cladophialophora chaetospira]